MENQGIKRKRKTFGSYLKWERYQGKRKLFGMGTELDEETFTYLLRIMEVSTKGFTTEEDREIFIGNVFEQTVGKEVDISSNQVGSRAMEMFLPSANDQVLLRFIDALSEDLRKTCGDRFASHVLQILIAIVSIRLQKVQSSNSEKETSLESSSSDPDVFEKFRNWLQKVGQFVINNLEEFVWDGYANHIIRTILECFSGLPPGSTTKEKKWEEKEWLPGTETVVSPIAEGFSLVQQCACRILKMSDVFDYVHENLISGLLQTILSAVHKVDKKLNCKILRHLLDYCIIEESQAAVRLMEVMINVAQRKTFVLIYHRLFCNKLVPLSLAPDANFCVQSLIKKCKRIEQYEPIFEELSPHFEELLQHNKHGVLLALGQSCQRLKCKQKEFFMQLQAAFHCNAPERQNLFPLLLAHWVDYETWCNRTKNEQGSFPVLLAGSLLIQTLLNFQESIKIIKPLLAMDTKRLLNVLNDRYGSHIGDAILDSQNVGEKQKYKFFQKLQGSFVTLVVTTYGSRILDKIWLRANLQSKKTILNELAASEDVVNSVKWGYYFAEKCNLSLYKRRPKEWEVNETQSVRVSKLFADITDN